jgi:membrane protein DedA with SNARE-associated domain
MAKLTADDIARERVIRRYGPRPKYEPMVVGVFAGIAAFLILGAYKMLEPGNPDPQGIVFTIVVVLAFTIGFGVDYWLCRRFDLAVAKEWLSIDEANLPDR